MKLNAADLRENYITEGLDESTIQKNPITLFEIWFKHAIEKKVLEPNAMTLATANRGGIPSARVVLLKDYSEKGFVFFTNYKSMKGEQLEQNPNAALVFWWGTLARQIRIEGVVEKVTAEESDTYFNLRPHGSQLGAVVSNQSKTIPNYSFLEAEFEKVSEKFKDKKIDRPYYWGGYRVLPIMIEFWQGRENRLHDRLRFTKNDSN
ncbi:MAG: pyridoxamine 5'-phosphate oxidase, partial [Melioribacteraceae bacterium]|nr:pyridoxamine 5'-phosphate oxidase [Melioribacteraceae bacterium]